jgi:hypothetical protein
MTLTSIMSYPNRGKWGDNKYRGNCSGYVIRDLLLHFQPKQFLEIFTGGGTGFEVARELGYEDSVHLDLNPRWGGWNALTSEVPEGSDFIFIHPPYHNIIQYSGVMWGQAHPDDLSRCASYEEFIKKLDLVHAKAYASLRNGGYMAILVGDCRKNGEYFSIQKDMAFIGKLHAHIIKTQHNCFSDNVAYANDAKPKGGLIRIMHEHLLIFQKDHVWVVPVAITKKVKRDLRDSLKITWRDLLQASLEELGGTATLERLYAALENTAKAKQNPHWKEKIRQTLQINSEFTNVSRGVWKLTPKARRNIA